jgi:hypothetical protein
MEGSSTTIVSAAISATHLRTMMEAKGCRLNGQLLRNPRLQWPLSKLKLQKRKHVHLFLCLKLLIV